MIRNLASDDLRDNPWTEDLGGYASQIEFWREELMNREIYDGELAEFEAYIKENNLEESE